MLLLHSNLSAFVLPHVFHALPQTFWPRYVTNEELYDTFSTIWARIEDYFVVEVCNILYLAQMT